jgi:hypothetical protein
MFAAINFYQAGLSLTAPVNTVAPAVTGTAQVRNALTCSTGTWSGPPTSYSYQWKRGATNVGTNSNTYTLVAADVGSTMTCVVTATNSLGSANATSNATSAVTANVPAAPTIGTATAVSGTSATVSYTAPSDNGGATITSYTAVSSPGSITGSLSTAGSGTITVSGLTLGTSYTFTVYATNSVGNSASSSASNSVTPNELYWEAFLYYAASGPSLPALEYRYVTPDASGNILIAGYSQFPSAGGSGASMVIKYSGAGSSLTQQFSSIPSYSGTEVTPCCCVYTYGYANAITYDSSNNIYATGSVVNNIFALAKYSSSGTLIDKKSFGANSATGQGVSIDSSNNIFISGPGGNGIFIHKYNSSYTLQWRRTFSGVDSGTVGNVRNVINSSTSVTYVVATLSSTSGCAIIAVNSSGATSWARQLTQSGTINGMDIKLDSSGNVYVVVSCLTLGKAVVAKYNSSGTLQWQRSLSGSGVDYTWGIAVDSSANVYVAGTTWVAKWNTSGTIQWQRVFGSGTPSLRSIAISGSSYYVSGSIGGSRAILFILPTDGSKTGTFPTLVGYTTTYAASTFTEAAGGMTDAAFTGANGTDSSNTLQNATWDSSPITRTSSIGQIT